MENPATRPACGAPNSDLAGASICSEYKSPTLHSLQARRLTRRAAVSMALAIAIVPFLHGEGA
ncbi:hypothetical protein M2172_000429 [Bradyrhizobium elkanii]|nr:hypothetical protein [Bradyrhizobium elkanii]